MHTEFASSLTYAAPTLEWLEVGVGKVFRWIGGSLGVFGFLALYAGAFIGWAYWMWMSVHLGSFFMFVFGLFGPLIVPATILGAWSLVFGPPLWLLHLVA
jgi:hypothetical protein